MPADADISADDVDDDDVHTVVHLIIIIFFLSKYNFYPVFDYKRKRKKHKKSVAFSFLHLSTELLNKIEKFDFL